MASLRSVLSCDLVDPATLSARLGVEDWSRVARIFEECCAEVIERFSGCIVSGPGAGLLASFGGTGENGAEPAVYAALALVEALDALNPQLEKDQRVWLEICVGIDTAPGTPDPGDSVVGRMDARVVARAVHLRELAPPGSVLISDATWRRVERRFVATRHVHRRDAPPAWLVLRAS